MSEKLKRPSCLNCIQGHIIRYGKGDNRFPLGVWCEPTYVADLKAYGETAYNGVNECHAKCNQHQFKESGDVASD